MTKNDGGKIITGTRSQTDKESRFNFAKECDGKRQEYRINSDLLKELDKNIWASPCPTKVNPWKLKGIKKMLDSTVVDYALETYGLPVWRSDLPL